MVVSFDKLLYLLGDLPIMHLKRIWPHCGAFCGPEKVDQKLGALQISEEYWTDNGHGSPGNCFPPRMISNLSHWHLFWWNQRLISRSWKGLNPDVWQYARETEEFKGPDSLKEGAFLLEVVYVFPFSDINYSMHHFSFISHVIMTGSMATMKVHHYCGLLCGPFVWISKQKFIPVCQQKATFYMYCLSAFRVKFPMLTVDQKLSVHFVSDPQLRLTKWTLNFWSWSWTSWQLSAQK